ncbi:hypothetical protein LEMLEM_LOCUS8229, partial [Lemmus lemmus]
AQNFFTQMKFQSPVNSGCPSLCFKSIPGPHPPFPTSTIQYSLDTEVGGRDARVKSRENENSPECETLTLSALEEDGITE